MDLPEHIMKAIIKFVLLLAKLGACQFKAMNQETVKHAPKILKALTEVIDELTHTIEEDEELKGLLGEIQGKFDEIQKMTEEPTPEMINAVIEFTVSHRFFSASFKDIVAKAKK